ncbi:MAG: hypothetical protein D6723_04845, partial [Acidobacteria bacterium]
MFLLEAIHQSLALSLFFSTFGERISFLTVLTFDILAGAIGGFLVGVGAIGLKLAETLLGNTKGDPERGHHPTNVVTLTTLALYALVVGLIIREPFQRDFVRTIIFYTPYGESGSERVLGVLAVVLFVVGCFVLLTAAQFLARLSSR